MPSDAILRLNVALEGRYRIGREIGEGGMATVYLAQDLRHERRVAIKVLRPELAALMGAERFVAEIKTTANLQHPHVLPLHDSGEADGFLFYVMPYVEGESLRERLDREKQLAVEDAVEIATKVAGALHMAHGRGVIHRDIKPANILLGEGGEPLVADFGIALAVQEAGGGRLTETGLSLGTPYYMSPEQATADRDPDARSDVYALACVLFEMLAGDPPHTASTAQATIAKILTDDAPPVTRHRKAVPTNVEAAIARGLQKVPADRFATAADFGRALADPGFRWSPGGGATVGTSTGRTPWRLVALVSIPALGLGALLGRSLDSGAAATAPPSYHVTLDPELSSTGTVGVTVAGDGTIIHQDHPGGAGTGPGEMPFVVRRPGASEPMVLTGTEGGVDGAVSPDGRWFAYRNDTENRIAQVSTNGGSPVDLLRWGMDPNEGGFWPQSWSSDGWIYGSLFAGDVSSSSLARLRAADGTMEALFQAEPGLTVSGAQVIPGDRKVVFDVGRLSGDPNPRILTLDVETRDTTHVTNGFGAQWSPSGHLIFSHQGSLFAIPFDPDSGARTGARFSLGIDLEAPEGLRWPRIFHLSASGSLVYIAGAPEWRNMWTVLASGDSTETIPLRPTFQRGLHYAISPDGERVAYGDPAGVVVQNLRTNGVDELALPGATSWAWSSEGEDLVLGDTMRSVLHVRTGGDGQPELTSLDLESGFAEPTDWLDDDRVLASWHPTNAAETDIVSIDLRTGAIEPILSGEWVEDEASVSPSGRWIAYETLQGGARRLVVRSFPELGPEVEVTRDDRESDWSALANIGPYWDHGEDALYYWENDAVWRVDVGAGPDGPRMGDRTRVLTLDSDDSVFGVHPDGRVLAGLYFEPGELQRPPRLMLVTDLVGELRALDDGGR